MRRRLACYLLILVSLVFFLAFPLPLGAQRPEGTNSGSHFVSLPAAAMPAFNVLGLTPQISLDYGSFYWFELNEADFARLSASNIPFEEDLEAGQLRLMNFTFDPARAGEPALPAQMRTEAASPGFRLVQFNGPIKDEWLTRLEAAGMRLLQYYPHHSYLVWASQSQARATEALDFVRWQGPFHPAYKTNTELAQKQGRIENVDIMFYNDGDIEATLGAIRRLGGVELQHYPSQPDRLFYNAIFQLDASVLADVAQLETVLWLGYSSPVPVLDDEMSGQILAGNHPGGIPFTGFNTWLSQAGVDGSGVIWAVVDTGVDYDHPDLNSRIVGGFSYPGAPTTNPGEDCATIGGHGTHVAGILGGDATAGFTDGSGFRYGLGIAPEVSIFAQNSLCGSSWPPIGGWQEHSKRSLLGGAVGSNSSWTTGEGTAHGYQASERTHDIMVRDGNFDTAGVAEPLIQVFSAGNSGPSPMTLTSPKDAKNLIAVANSLNQRAGSIDSISNSSSRGPAVDGRWVPVIAAPGSQIASTRNDLGGDCSTAIAGTSNRYAFCSGTSMAAPHVSGALALVTQWWRTFNAGANPSPAMAKALLVNGAVDMGAADIPNTSEGWGRLNLTRIISSSVNVLYDDQTRTFGQTGQLWAKAIEVDNPGQPLKITLAWTDAPGAVGANPALVNNLDLRVADQNGVIYRGNVFNSGWSASGGSADTRNNLENVYLQNPSGRFIITIQATNLAGDGVPYNGDTTDQDFALVCTNCTSLPEGILAGTVTNAATAAPINGATVVASASPSQVFATSSGSGGKYSLPLPAGSYNLTVSAFGYLTQTINNISVSANITTTRNVALVGAPALTVTTVQVSGGDGDAALEPDETAYVSLGLTNLGFGAATNVSGVVATAHPQATLLNNASGYATIAPGATVHNTVPFRVQLSPSFACGDPLLLTATITTAQGNLIVPVTIPTAQQFTPFTYISSNVPQNFPVPVSAVTSTLAITNISKIADVNVTLSINHPWDADLDLFLRAPTGTEVELSSGNGSSGNDYLSTTFDDEAATPITSGAPPFSGSFRPEQPLSLLDGSNTNGAWALKVIDTEPDFDGGVLTGWRLTLLQPICEASPSVVYFPLILKQ